MTAITRPPPRWFRRLAVGLMPLAACALDGREAARVEVELHADAVRVATTNTDLGWEVTLDRCRAIVEDVAFTTAGTMHASSSVFDYLWPRAWAHPGHQAGGEVIGEAPGRIVVDLCSGDDQMLATATLLEGDYNGANFTWTRAGTDDVAAEDPLLGHTMLLEGTAARDGETVRFRATIDQDDGRALIGAQFDATVSSAFDGRVVFSFTPYVDLTSGGEHVFDAIAFDELGARAPAEGAEGGGVIDVEPGTTTHNQLRNTLQRHDFFVFRAQVSR
jgi:hypothetical protein